MSTRDQQPRTARPTQSEGPDPREGWRARAACRGVDPELFFPAADSGPARKVQIAAAKAVCGRCPVRVECLAEALRRIPYGIAGGLTEQERHRLRIQDPGPPGRCGPRQQRDGLSAEAREVLCDGPGLLRGRQRARVGRVLLAAGCPPRRIAAVCGVSERTVACWARDSTTTSTGTASGGGSGVGEGSTAATGLPSGSPEHTTPQAGTRAPEGLRA